jgi:hypothetical protein
MRRILLTGLIAGGLAALSAGPAAAQYRPARPTWSPYLNLLRRDSSLIQNYQGLVRPEIEFRGNIQQLRQDVTADREAAASENLDETGGLPPTGHAVGFQTQSRYFMTLGGGSSVGRSGMIGQTGSRIGGGGIGIGFATSVGRPDLSGARAGFRAGARAGAAAARGGGGFRR